MPVEIEPADTIPTTSTTDMASTTLAQADTTQSEDATEEMGSHNDTMETTAASTTNSDEMTASIATIESSVGVDGGKEKSANAGSSSSQILQRKYCDCICAFFYGREENIFLFKWLPQPPIKKNNRKVTTTAVSIKSWSQFRAIFRMRLLVSGCKFSNLLQLFALSLHSSAN